MRKPRTWTLFGAAMLCATLAFGGCEGDDSGGDDDDDGEVDAGTGGTGTGGAGVVDAGSDADSPDASGDAGGEVIYTDVDPDFVMAEWEVYALKLHAPAEGYGQPETYYLWFHPWNPNEVLLNTFDSDCQALAAGGGLPLALDLGAPIDASATTWSTPNNVFLNQGGATGNWVGVTDRFLGLRFKLEGSWHYGWARLDIDATPTGFVVKDYAYQSVPEVGLSAGDGMP